MVLSSPSCNSGLIVQNSLRYFQPLSYLYLWMYIINKCFCVCACKHIVLMNVCERVLMRMHYVAIFFIFFQRTEFINIFWKYTGLSLMIIIDRLWQTNNQNKKLCLLTSKKKIIIFLKSFYYESSTNHSKLKYNNFIQNNSLNLLKSIMLFEIMKKRLILSVFLKWDT